MSLGLSASDFITVPRFAWKVYLALKNGPSNFRDLSNDVLSVHVILREIEDNVREQDLDAAKAERLSQLATHCHEVLKDIESVLVKYESLATSSQRVWERMKFGMEDIQAMRLKLQQGLHSLTAFNSVLTQSSVLRLEKLLLKYIEEMQAGNRENSTVSVQTLQSIRDSPSAWKDVARDLKDVGITSEMIHEHREYIVRYIQNAIAQGKLDEVAPSSCHSIAPAPDFCSIREIAEALPAEIPLDQERLKTLDASHLAYLYTPPASNVSYREYRRPSLPENSTYPIESPHGQNQTFLPFRDSDRPKLISSLSHDGLSCRSTLGPDCSASQISSQSSTINESDYDLQSTTSLSTITSAESSMSRSPTMPLSPVEKSHKILGIGDVKIANQSKESLFSTTFSRSRKGSLDSQRKISTSLMPRIRAPKFFTVFNASVNEITEEEPKPIKKERRPSDPVLDAQDGNGDTPLHRAAADGDLSEVMTLLTNGAHVNKRNHAGNTPVHLAAERDHGEILIRLLDKRANVEIENKQGRRMLHLLAQHGSSSTLISALSSHHLSPWQPALPNHTAQDHAGNTPIHCAAEAGNQHALKVIYDIARVNSGLGFADVWSACLRIRNAKGESPLHCAAKSGNIAILRQVCELAGKKMKHALYSANDENFNKPLHFAAANGHADAVGFLLKASAKCGAGVENATNGSGLTPLFMAIEKGHTAVVEELVKVKHVDVNQDCPLGSGVTPLVAAQTLKHARLVQILMARGASVAVMRKGSVY